MHGLLGITVLWTGDLLADAMWERLSAWSWVLVPMVILAFLLWRGRSAFRADPMRPGRKGLFAISLANCVTLCRGLLICGLGGFVSTSQFQGFLGWVPSILYASAAAADGLDGWIARARKEASPVGEVFDREVDALGTSVAAILACQSGRLPAFYLPVSGAYYLFNLAIWFRTRHGKPVHPLRPSRARRAIGTVQTLFLILLLSPLPTPDEGFLLAVGLTPMVSASFLRDWIAVVGADWRARWGRLFRLR